MWSFYNRSGTGGDSGMMLSLYRAAIHLGAPFIRIYLKHRIAEGKEDHLRFAERKGKSITPRPVGRLIWVHGASVGEALSVLPLIESLLQMDELLHVLLTTGTVSSAEFMADKLPNRAFHQYVPVDRINYVRRFLGHWKPDMALWVESEFWPNLILETQKRGTPMILVNGRISPKSFAGWKRARTIISRLLQNFELCLGQTKEDAERLRQLGAKSYKCVGNLKFSVPPLPAQTEELIRMQQDINARPRWLAASTHDGEEELAAYVHKELKKTYESFLSILVPRHPTRGHEIAAMLKEEKGLKIALRSQGDPLTPETDIYLVDTMGELGLFFRLSDIVFMGKSLVPLGGQNPLEALRLECAVVHGPHMTNFQSIVSEMSDFNCAISVPNGEALARAINHLISNEDIRTSMIANGLAYLQSQSEVAENVKNEIMVILQNRVRKTKTDATT